MDKPHFEKMIADGELLEYASYAGNYYGTPEKAVDDALAQGINVVLEIEVQGALQVIERRRDAISIFVAPPSFSELRYRLLNRGDTAPEIAERRLHIAEQECRTAEKYQYIVVNDTVEHAAAEIRAILTAEECRSENRFQTLKEEL